MPLSTGQVLNNRYRIAKLLGQGGFGAVYRAWDVQMAEACAVKENLDTSIQAHEQFVREARLLFKLRHPGLPVVYDQFTIPGQGQYLVMDYIDGQDLQEMLDGLSPSPQVGRGSSGLPESQVLPWMLQVCEALAYLHSQTPAVIHRDIKPANIKITPKGQAVLVDFGIAKVLDPALKTATAARAVTPGYSPQEQYTGMGTGPYSDVYALGATLYALLTGTQPVESVARNLGTVLQPPRRLNPSLSPPVEQVILKAMAMQPGDRYASIAEFAAAVEPAPPAPAPPPPAPVTAAPPVQAAAQSPAPAPPAINPLLASTLVAPSPMGKKPSRRIWRKAEIILGLLAIAALGGMLVFTINYQIRLNTLLQRGVTPLDTQVSPVDGMPMVYVPAGEFLMGSNPGDPGAGQPQHEVYLDAYWIDQTEVTNAMYVKCVAAGACQPPSRTDSFSRNTYYGDPQYAGYPVIYVSWDDADAYCRWAGRGLPTEAQWEKAARGEDGQFYPWGDWRPRCDVANYSGCTGDTTQVGSYPAGASPYGALDMVGNVQEWVNDWYGVSYYSESPTNNPPGPDTGEIKLLRGGSWELDFNDRRGYNLGGGGVPSLTHFNLGFRCARSP